MILCVTPNPALDRTLLVPDFAAGTVSRAQSTLEAAGGKGINVARAVRILGGESIAAGFLGGRTGHYVADLAESEGLAATWTWLEGETRTCTIIANSHTGEATVINEQGPDVTAKDWLRLHQDVIQLANNKVQQVCFSGSLPPGSPVEAYQTLIQLLHRAGKQIWIDTSGTALQSVRHIPHIAIKVNGDEAGAILQRKIWDAETALSAALELQQAGPDIVVLTLGPNGAVMAHPAGRWWAKPPVLKVVDPIGSGDSFLAGLVTSLEAHYPPQESLRRAVAAGAANALSVGGGQFPLDDFNQVLSETALQFL